MTTYICIHNSRM